MLKRAAFEPNILSISLTLPVTLIIDTYPSGIPERHLASGRETIISSSTDVELSIIPVIVTSAIEGAKDPTSGYLSPIFAFKRSASLLPISPSEGSSGILPPAINVAPSNLMKGANSTPLIKTALPSMSAKANISGLTLSTKPLASS